MRTTINQNATVKMDVWQAFALRAFSLYLFFYFLFISEFINDFGDVYKWVPSLNTPFIGAGIWLMRQEYRFIPDRKFPGWVGFNDTRVGLAAVLTFLVLAVLAAATWTMIDKGRKFPSHFKYMHTFARYYLAFIMLSYGMMKVFDQQFHLFPDSMSVTVGHVNPMNVLWICMSISKSYKFFGGLCEIVPAILLMFGRTSTIGALIALGALLNVLMLNVAYEVPLKLFLLNLILFAIFILLPQIKRLYRIFVLQRTASLFSIQPLLSNHKRLRYIVKFLILGLWLFMFLKLNIGYVIEENSPYKQLMGIYPVGQFSRKPLKTLQPSDSLEWREVAIDDYDLIDIRLTNDSIFEWSMKVDTTKKLLKLTSPQDTAATGLIHFSLVSPNTWKFEGIFKNDSVSFVSKRIGMYAMPLMRTYGKVQWFRDSKN
jgi:hypothetical protein